MIKEVAAAARAEEEKKAETPTEEVSSEDQAFEVEDAAEKKDEIDED